MKFQHITESRFTDQEVAMMQSAYDEGEELGPRLEEKAIDFALDHFADEIPYGTQTGDEATMDEWLYDNMQKVIAAIKGKKNETK